MNVADRLRGIVRGPAGSALHPASAPATAPAADVEAELGATWQPESRSFVVERRLEASASYGNVRVDEIAGWLERSAVSIPMLSGDPAAVPPFVFFDLETTGLSGGAGTYAFLIGCAWFADEGAFVTRQYLLAHYGDERRMLETVAGDFMRAGALVSFNGRSFDMPLLDMRHLFHRLAWAGPGLPHVDVLHPARRFWGATSCTLGALESRVLGVRRVDDVPGAEIPARYFDFVRSGDARPLKQVLAHNRLDLISLAGIAGRLAHLTRCGIGEAHDAREAAALGRTYAQAGMDQRSREAFERALELATAGLAHPQERQSIQVDALRALALAARRAGEYDAAARRWRSLLELNGCPPHAAREAAEALAVHHEHRVRDLKAAREFALQSLEVDSRPVRDDAVRHRLARIERKMKAEVWSLKSEVEV